MTHEEKLMAARAWMRENQKDRQRMFGRRRRLTPDWLKKR